MSLRPAKTDELGSKEKTDTGLFRGVFTAYSILVLHVLLMVLIGGVVILFRGVVHYMVWILVGCGVLLAVSGYLFFRRMKREGKAFRDMMDSPVFKGKSLEISFMGGIATFKIENSNRMPMLGNSVKETALQLEDPDTIRLRAFNDLSRLLEKGLITPEEFHKTKQQIFGEESL